MLFKDKFYPAALQYSLEEFCNDGVLCDVTFEVDGYEFQAHKVILSAASPYFRAMFSAESSFIESKENKINLYGVDKDATANIFKFIYSSVIEINDDNVYSLMEAADLLQINALRTYISFYLGNSLNTDNCLQMFITANLYQYHDLAKKAFHIVLVNFSEIIKSNEFLKIPFEILLDIISSKLLDIPNEEILLENIFNWVSADVESRKQHLDSLISKINLNLISEKFLIKMKNNSLCTSNIRKTIEEIIDSSSTKVRERQLFPPMKPMFYQEIRHKDEEAVIFAIGGESSGTASQSVECFTIGYDKWRYIVPECIIRKHETKHTSVLPPLRCARYYAAYTNDSYNVYVIGGKNSTTLLDECEVYNVKTNQWNYFHKLPVKLFGSGAVFLEGELVVVGGCNEEGISDKVWKLDKVNKLWKPMPSLNSPRYFHATVAAGGFIFVMGGYNESKESTLSTCEKFDPSCNKWFEIPSMHQSRAKFGCAAVKDDIFVFGGTCNDTLCTTSVEKYNIFTNQWTYQAPMNIPRHSFSVAVSDDLIYCLGGSDCIHFLDSVEKFSLRSRRWHCVHSMQVSRLASAAAALLVPYFSSE